MEEAHVRDFSVECDKEYSLFFCLQGGRPRTVCALVWSFVIIPAKPKGVASFTFDGKIFKPAKYMRFLDTVF